jgi:hypothetical protein
MTSSVEIATCTNIHAQFTQGKAHKWLEMVIDVQH